MITAGRILTLLSLDELKSELTRLPGLIPIGFDRSLRQLRWLDLSTYHCYQGFFRDALAFYRALSASEPAEMCSGLDVLAAPDLIPGAIAPTGFIFHAGRCGSTLLARVLARSRSNSQRVAPTSPTRSSCRRRTRIPTPRFDVGYCSAK